MNKKTRLVSFLAIVAVCGSTWLWGAGCDFTAIDEGADAPLPELLTAVSSAQTEAEAKQQIQRLLNKAEIGVRWRPSIEPGPYDHYTLDDAALSTVARAQAGFNAGNREQGTTVQRIYEELLAAHEAASLITSDAVFEFTPPAITATLDEVLKSFYVVSRQAVANPEKPENALLLSIVAEGAVLPDSTQDVPLLAPDHVLSPVQRLLFGIWLLQNGPSLPLYVDYDESADKLTTGGPNLSCPSGYELTAKFEWKGQRYVFEKPSGNQNIVTISGNATSGTWQSTKPIARVILKGGTETDVLVVNDARSGSFNNGNLVSYNKQNKKIKHDISNIQFCSGKKPPEIDWCKKECYVKFVLCLLCGGNCTKELEKCLGRCHDQGGG